MLTNERHNVLNEKYIEHALYATECLDCGNARDLQRTLLLRSFFPRDVFEMQSGIPGKVAQNDQSM